MEVLYAGLTKLEAEQLHAGQLPVKLTEEISLAAADVDKITGLASLLS